MLALLGATLTVYYRRNSGTSSFKRTIHADNTSWTVSLCISQLGRTITDGHVLCSEYPNFFTKLYNLLDEEALHVRYRPRFMRMLDIFLASP